MPPHGTNRKSSTRCTAAPIHLKCARHPGSHLSSRVRAHFTCFLRHGALRLPPGPILHALSCAWPRLSPNFPSSGLTLPCRAMLARRPDPLPTRSCRLSGADFCGYIGPRVAPSSPEQLMVLMGRGEERRSLSCEACVRDRGAWTSAPRAHRLHKCGLYAS